MYLSTEAVGSVEKAIVRYAKMLPMATPCSKDTDVSAEQVDTLSEKKYLSLKKKLLKFRDDELEHKDIAIEHDGQYTPGYKLLKFVVQSGCKAAIKISEKI